MLLDLLPFRHNKGGRLPGKWGWIRYVPFFASLILVLVLWSGVVYRPESQGWHELWWLVVGNTFYYLSAVLLALTVRDNRAFCKYLCPIPPLQKLTARFALLKVEGKASLCNDCGACVRALTDGYSYL